MKAVTSGASPPQLPTSKIVPFTCSAGSRRASSSPEHAADWMNGPLKPSSRACLITIAEGWQTVVRMMASGPFGSSVESWG